MRMNILSLFSVFVMFAMGTFGGVASSGVEMSKKVADCIADLSKKFGADAEGLAKVFKGKNSDEALESIQKIAKVIPSEKYSVFKTILEKLSESQLKTLAKLIEKYPDLLEVVGDPQYLKFIEKYFVYIEALYRVAKQVPGKQTVQLFEKLVDMRGGDQVIGVLKDWGTYMGAGKYEDLIHLKRLLDGKTYSPEAVVNVINGFKKAAGEGVISLSHWGDFLEDMAKTAIDSGRMQVGIKKGSTLIRGQHTGRTGIDLIGVAEDGRPLILEVGGWKNFADKGLRDASGMVEMSPAWVADRWNKIFNIADPNELEKVIQKFREMGIPPRYLPPNIVTPEMVKTGFIRKVVVPDTTQVKNLAEIGMDGTKDVVTF